MPVLVPSAMKNDLSCYLKWKRKSGHRILAFKFFCNIFFILNLCSIKMVKTRVSAKQGQTVHFSAKLPSLLAPWVETFFLGGGVKGAIWCHLATEASSELSIPLHSWLVIDKVFHETFVSLESGDRSTTAVHLLGSQWECFLFLPCNKQGCLNYCWGFCYIDLQFSTIAEGKGYAGALKVPTSEAVVLKILARSRSIQPTGR